MEIGCPACGRTLRLPDEHAGKQIRCPACQQISVAPGKTESGETQAAEINAAGGREATTWHLRMPEGPIYGPIRWDEVIAWAGEGRISADCELGPSQSGPWQKANNLLPRSVGKLPDAAGPEAPEAYPWATSPQSPGGGGYALPGGGYIAAHRGGLILVLGLLSWMGCPLLSFAAWIMGSHDLREMRSGRMDRGGEAATLAGMIFGMIVSGMWILIVVVSAVILLIVALLR